MVLSLKQGRKIMAMTTGQKVCNGFAALLSLIVWIATLLVGVLEHSQNDLIEPWRNVLFTNNSDVITESWGIVIAPPQWAMSIWEFSYTWNTLWVFYTIANPCTTRDSSELKIPTKSINVFPTSFHILWILTSFSHVGCMFFWDKESLIAALFFRIFVIIFSACTLIVSYRAVEIHGAILQHYYPWVLWVCRTLVQNGITIHLVWNILLLGKNFTAVLLSSAVLRSETIPVVALSCFSAFIIAWFIAENFILDQWVRYTFTVYPTVIWGIGAILTNVFEPWTIPTNLCCAIIATSVLCLVIRVPVVVWKSFSSPLYGDHTLPHVVVNKNSVPRSKRIEERKHINCVY